MKLTEGTWSLAIGAKGIPSYERYLHAKYRRPTIRFSGYVTPEAFLPEIDVLIVPSLWHEPFGRTVIEAFAHGVPVIGSKRGGITSLIEEGSTGFLFDPGYPEELTAKMQLIIDRS